MDGTKITIGGGESRTIRELYQWAEENGALDLDIEIQHRDDGGYYYGFDDPDPCIDDRYESYHTPKVVNL